MALLTLTGVPGETVYINTDNIVGFGPDPTQMPHAGTVIMVMTGPYWSYGTASFSVTQTPAQVAAMWPGAYSPGSIPLSALQTTGVADATTFLRGDGAYTVLTQP